MPYATGGTQPLRANGLKTTKQRKAILQVLTHAGKPLTAEELYIRLNAEHPNASLSTVYRALESLCAHGVLQSVTLSGDNRMAYVMAGGHLHYIVCSQCKGVAAISQCPLHTLEQSLAEETGYLLQGHRLDLYGLCPDCQRKQTDASGPEEQSAPMNQE
jgi:Fur family ferric uptake transcriptional regulator